jgi:hypothetical protein
VFCIDDDHSRDVFISAFDSSQMFQCELLVCRRLELQVQLSDVRFTVVVADKQGNS